MAPVRDWSIDRLSDVWYYSKVALPAMSFPTHRLWLVGALVAATLVTGCSTLRRTIKPSEPPQVMELGAAETRKEPIPPESPALSHFLAGTLAMNRGDYDEASEQFEKSVAADPHSALLRQRL